LPADCLTLTVASEPFEQLQQDWTALADRLPRPLPFHRPAWHHTWWSHFGDGREPLYLAVREDGTLAAVVPLMRDGDTIALAGDPQICDYTDLPVTAADPASLLPGVLDALEAMPWQTLHLWGLPEDAPALAITRTWAELRGHEVEVDFEAVCPRIAPLSDWDAYLASLSKKDRHELKRKMRRFEESGGDVCTRILTTPAEVDAALDTFFHLHRVSRHDKAQFMTPAMEAFFRDMAVRLAADGLVRLYLIEVNAQPAAALLAFRSGDELLLYNSGYDPAFSQASVGIVSKAMALQSAIADGVRAFDFLRGAEPYKYDLGGTDRIVRQLWVRRNDRGTSADHASV
jgi:CelD/BcsL family acetyltransferase involved in cellulose biosynthesis